MQSTGLSWKEKEFYLDLVASQYMCGESVWIGREIVEDSAKNLLVVFLTKLESETIIYLSSESEMVDWMRDNVTLFSERKSAHHFMTLKEFEETRYKGGDAFIILDLYSQIDEEIHLLDFRSLICIYPTEK